MPRPKKVLKTFTAPDDVPVSATATVINNWTAQECQQLVDLIEKNGFDGDVSAILRHFPGHTETNFRQLMRSLEDKPVEGEQYYTTTMNLLNLIEMTRANHMSASHGSVVPSLVDLVSNFGENPSPDMTGGVDYGEIERTMAALMKGEIPRKVNAPTAAKFLDLIEAFLGVLANQPGSNKSNEAQPIKRPVVSIVKEPQQRNATLASRRSESWSPAEIHKGKMLITKDLKTLREIYLAPSWADPYRFSEEASQFRKLKVIARNIREALAVAPAKQTKAVKRKRRARK